ncbi:pilus assembly protein TadG-related protein [Oryzobacter telluris]|uniref:pilus assembly protein TadG-related protein n=1 Tax=Oryzobacter telluris TaxID=3149179 RepID=UPI00370D5E6B
MNRTPRQRDERGSVSVLILGLTMIAAVLIAGTIAVTSAHLSRMRLLDVADGAALSAANALDASAYREGVGQSVPVSNASVREEAARYVGSRPRPGSITAWRLGPETGSPDGATAVVTLTGEAQLPLVGGVLRSLGVSITISVRSEARADLVVP